MLEKKKSILREIKGLKRFKRRFFLGTSSGKASLLFSCLFGLLKDKKGKKGKKDKKSQKTHVTFKAQSVIEKIHRNNLKT
jgi:hypothetical protein